MSLCRSPSAAAEAPAVQDAAVAMEEGNAPGPVAGNAAGNEAAGTANQPAENTNTAGRQLPPPVLAGNAIAVQ